jgi:hypothetical protein
MRAKWQEYFEKIYISFHPSAFLNVTSISMNIEALIEHPSPISSHESVTKAWDE